MKQLLTLLTAVLLSQPGFALSGDIDITGNSVGIVAGDMSPTTADHTDFGSVLECSGTIVRTFTVRNAGVSFSDLVVSSVTITGANAGDFIITASPVGGMRGGQSRTLQISFDPAGVGLRTAVVTVYSDDPDESVYDFAIQGTGNADIVNPVASCRNLTVYLSNVSGTANIIPVQMDNGSTDNCGIATRTLSQSSFSCADLGSNSVTLTVRDAGNNPASCAGIVTVLDSTHPVAACRNLSLYLNSSGTASVVPAMVDNGSTDNCGITSMNVTPSSFSCANVGPNTVTLTVTDASGNSSVCTSIVTVIDSVRPVATCHDTTLYISSSGNLVINPVDLHAGASDACGIASMSVFPNTFSCSQVANQEPITLTVTDVNGNTGTCVSRVNIYENLAPVAICHDVTVYLNATGSALVTTAMVNNGSYDECSIAMMRLQPFNSSSGVFTCSDVGNNTVTLDVFDTFGQIGSCSSTVTVLDTVRPVAATQNISLYLNASGSATLTGAMINNGSSDACGIASMTVTPSTFSCADVGANNVTFTVTDVNGNTSVSNAVVTVVDTVHPGANCRNVTLQLNPAGSASIVPAMLNNGSTDNCGIASMSVSQNTFSCANIGPNNVTLTVTDNSGNTSSCTAIVTVADTVRPAVTCTNSSVYLDASGNGFPVPWMPADACGISTYNVSPNTFSCANVGPNTVTLTATDVNGNVSVCSSIVTVLDTVRPVANTQNISVHLNASGNASVTGAMLNNGSSDACGIASMTVAPSTFSCANVGANNVTFTVTDVNGNTRSRIAVVTVIDTVHPVAIAQNLTVTLSGGTATVSAASVNNGSSDACGIASMTVTPNTFTCSNLGANTVTLTVTDVNGNVSSATAVVTVLNDLVPVASVVNNVNCYGAPTGHATITVSGGVAPFSYLWAPAGGTGATTTGVPAGVYTSTITDAAGCSATQTISITQPNAPLAVSMASQQNVSCNGGSDGAAEVVATGGVCCYTYNWAPGNPTGDGTASVSGLTAGTYFCQVTDGGGCSYTQVVNILQPSPVTAAAVSGNISCNGGGTTVNVSASGGTSPYTGEGTFTVTAGTYSYTVTDAHGCTATTPVNITEPPVLTASASATPILCNGYNSTVTVNATGGTPSYSGTGSFTVTAGTMNYTVTDANGCTASSTITVTEPTPLVAGCSATPILCNGGSSTVTVSATGGVPAYSGTGNISVTPGVYNYTVTDANGCTCSTSITVTEPPLLTTSSSSTPILCNGGSSTVTVIAGGGTPAYSGDGNFSAPAGTQTYTVTDANGCTSTTTITITEPAQLTASSSASTIQCNGGTASVAVSATGGTPGYIGDGSFIVTAGTYTYTITDNNGCTATTGITVTEPSAISTSVTFTNVLCNGDANGAIDLTVSGGTSPYTYDWNNGTYTTEDLSGLIAGTYSGVLTDANGCTYSGTITITEPAALAAGVTAMDPTTCSGTDGAVDITVTGGTMAYAFLWNNAATTEDISGVGAGVYSCVVTDANGCTTNAGATLSDPNAPSVFLSLPLDTICFDDGAIVLTGENPAGGIFSGPGVSGGAFDPGAAGIGIHPVVYTYTDGNGCTGSATDTVNVDACLGIETQEANLFDVYPNPNNGVFTLQVNSTDAVDVEIYDALGNLVLTQKVQAGIQTELSINAPGLYMLTVVTADGKRTTKRVIVDR